MRTYQALGDGAKFRVEGVPRDGSRVAHHYTKRYDGKDSPYTGAGTPSGKILIALKRIEVTSTIKKAGKVVQTGRSASSKYVKVMTFTTKETNTPGQPTNNTTAYDEQ